MHYNSNDFIQKVCEQIGFKAAHKGIEQELESHIDDNIEEFIAQGLDEKTATMKAIECMGDPIEIGEELNRIHKPQTEWGVIGLVFLLSIFGVGSMLFIKDLPHGSSSIFGKRQFAYIILGMSLLIGIYLWDYMKLYKYSRALFVSGMVLTIITVLFGTVENNLLYLKMGPISFTTGSLCNLMFMVSIITELSKCRDNGIIAFLKICSLCAISLVALVFNRAVTLSFIMIMVYGIILIVAVNKGHFNYKQRWGYLCILCGIMVISLIVIMPHILSINNNLHANGYSTNIWTKYLETAQWRGKSAFLGIHGWRYLPKNWTGYFLTIIIANFGWFIGYIVIALFLILFGIMVFRTLYLKNIYGFYMATGACAYLIVNFILNILIIMGYAQNFDCNLSFVSFGGTDYVNNILIIGIFLAIWRRNLIAPSDMFRKYKI